MQVRKELKWFESKMDEAHSQLASSEQEAEQLRGREKELKEAQAKLQAQLEEAKGKLAQAEEQKADADSQQHRQLQEDVQNLRDHVKKLQAQLQDLQQRLAQAEKVRGELQAVANAHKEENERLQEAAKKLQERLSDAERELKEACGSRDGLQDEARQHAEQHKKVQERLEVLKKQMAAATAQLQDAEKERELLRRQHTDLQQQLQAKVDEVQNRHEAPGAEAGKYSLSSKGIEKQPSSGQAIIQRQQEQLAAARAKHSQQERELQEQVEALKALNEELSSQLQAAQKSPAAVGKQHRSVAATAAAATATIPMSKAIQRKEDDHTLATRITDLETDLAALAKQRDDALDAKGKADCGVRDLAARHASEQTNAAGSESSVAASAQPDKDRLRSEFNAEKDALTRSYEQKLSSLHGELEAAQAAAREAAQKPATKQPTAAASSDTASAAAAADLERPLSPRRSSGPAGVLAVPMESARQGSGTEDLVDVASPRHAKSGNSGGVTSPRKAASRGLGALVSSALGNSPWGDPAKENASGDRDAAALEDLKLRLDAAVAERDRLRRQVADLQQQGAIQASRVRKLAFAPCKKAYTFSLCNLWHLSIILKWYKV